jgi:hypothetical protein
LEKIVGWLDYSSMVSAEKSKDDQFDREKLKENSEPRETAALFTGMMIGFLCLSVVNV